MMADAAPEGAAAARADAWPELPLSEWGDTSATLHLWLQMVGKTRLALAPAVNHWWHCTLYVSARGLTTSRMPVRRGDGTSAGGVEIEFDFLDHVLEIRRDDGVARRLALAPRSVADFYAEYTTALRELGIEAHIWPLPVEIADPIPFADDQVHAAYDAAYAQRFWRALAQADRLLAIFRGRFLGKCSPVHFFWGGVDLACTRFNGRLAPRHPGGVPNMSDAVTWEAYSHECLSAGWWAGTAGGPVTEPAFYAYAYPEPPGYAEPSAGPPGATYQPDMRIWILPWDVVRAAPDPDAAVLDFLEGTYAAGATLAGWDRAALERLSG